MNKKILLQRVAKDYEKKLGYFKSLDHAKAKLKNSIMAATNDELLARKRLEDAIKNILQDPSVKKDKGDNYQAQCASLYCSYRKPRGRLNSTWQIKSIKP